MANVVLVCVAGVSGTFLASGMRRIDPTLTTVVTTFERLPDLEGGDAVLLAPQLADRIAAVRQLVAPRPVALLGAATGARGAAAAVAQARELLAQPAYGGAQTPETKE